MAHAEDLLISAVIRENDHVSAAARGITSKFFHLRKEEWRFIERFVQQYRKTPSKAAFLKKFPDFKFYAANDVEHFVDEVKQTHTRVVMSKLIKTSVSQIARGQMEEAIRTLHSGTVNLESELMGSSEDDDVLKGDGWKEAYREVKRKSLLVGSRGMAGIPTGFPTLDERTGGFQPGELWIVAARLGQGKTWTLSKMAAACALAGYRGQYDSLEQSRNQINLRIQTILGHELRMAGRMSTKEEDLVRMSDLVTGTIDLRKYRRFLRNLPGLVDGQLHISDTTRGRVSPMTVAAQIERNKPDIVYIDYLTLMEQTGDDWRATAKLSSEMKQVAQRYQVPIVAAAQINRTGNNGKKGDPPGAENLSYSDAIGQDADGIVTLSQMSDRVVQMKLAKYRHGRDGFLWWNTFQPNTGVYNETDRDNALDMVDEDESSQTPAVGYSTWGK